MRERGTIRVPTNCVMIRGTERGIFEKLFGGRDARILNGDRLSAERKIYMDWEVSELGHKRPFYYDVLEGKRAGR